MDKFKDLNDEALSAFITEKRTAFDALIATDAPTDEQVEQAEALATEVEEAQAEQERRATAAREKAEKFASLRTRFSSQPEENEEPVEEEPEEVAPEETPSADPNTAPSGAEAPPATEPRTEARSKGVQRLAAKTARPAAPQVERGMVKITAAQDVPGFSTGSSISDLDKVAEAVIARTKGFAPPTGDGSRVELQKFGVANITIPFESEFTIDRGTDDMEVLSRAAKESRLDGGSLVAAGGWCAPSETLYDLASDESLEGLLSLPEVNVRRGGIRYTQGPQFADFYANAGFVQTEAQAIAGTTKPCYEVACPDFTEVRLDAVGVCIKVPILTNAAYPELIRRFTEGTLIAHEHMVNANVIGRIQTLAGAARVVTGIGSSVADVMGALELLADQRRQAYRLPLRRTLEVVVPFWIKGNLRSDLANRNGVSADAITDAQIDAHWRARNLNVQYVYDWQPLPDVDDAGTAGRNESVQYPETVNVLMYPAGTFVKGTSDVINLSAVYDAASLATNTYTGLFMEQGLLVAQMQYDADLVTLPLRAVGATGPQDLAAAAGSWA